jgi:nucleoside-diphosphate-sugar epimerase
MEQKQHRILILGATGQIGSKLVPALARRGHFIIAVSRNKHNLFDSDVAAGNVECVQVRNHFFASDAVPACFLLSICLREIHLTMSY